MNLLNVRVSLAVACLLVFFSGVAPALAADKEIVELQRQVASVTDQLNTLQSAITNLQSGLSEKLGAQSAILQQTLDRINQVHTENAVGAKTVTDQIGQQDQRVAATVAALNAKIDQMLSQFSAAQDNISDMNSRMGRLEQKIVDLSNAVKVLQAGPAPPPTGPQAAGGPPPGVTAEGLFQDASRDQLSGKSGLALQEYNDYLKYFGDLEMAASAQFHIGEILLGEGNVDDAIAAFDAVATQYPKSSKAPDALYTKAEALQKQGKRPQATQVLNQLIRLYPDSDAAGRAKEELPAPRRSSRK